jgi:putative sterol carrier protein
VADFLSDSWFDRLNRTLSQAGPVPVKPDVVFRIVIEMTDTPGGAPHALTLTIRDGEAKVDAGDNLLADTLIRMTYADARALFRGDIDSAGALREGRVKVRGNINALVPLLEWMQHAHPVAGEPETGTTD